MRIAALQMNSTPDLHANLAQARGLLDLAMTKGAEMVVFPECFGLMADTKAQWRNATAPFQEHVLIQTLQEWAMELDVILVGSGIPVLDPKQRKPFNATVLVANDGAIKARYNKVHLYKNNDDDETKLFAAGDSLICPKVPHLGRVGFTTCFDLRFPEMYRKLADQGATVFLAPSAFREETGKAHWDVLTRARAIENQAYLIAAAQYGQNTPHVQTYGHARIVDPWGRVIAEQISGPGMAIAEVNPEAPLELRKRFPVLKSRKF